MNDVPAGAIFFVSLGYDNSCGLDCPHGYNWYTDHDECKKLYRPDNPLCPVGSMYDGGYGCVKCPIEDACLSGLGCEYGYQDTGCGNCIDGWFFINDQCRKYKLGFD